MSGDLRISRHYNSVASPDHILSVAQSCDMDVWLSTAQAHDLPHAQIRLRTYTGGGSNVLLCNIMRALTRQDRIDDGQLDMIDDLYPATGLPNQVNEFSFRCDDNPGSYLKIALAEERLGIQTGCFDEELDYRAGGFMHRQGDGPMVWLHAGRAGGVHRDLTDYLVRHHPVENYMAGRAFHFLDLGPR